MPYIGKKPADIIATVIDTTTGTFSGDLTVDTNTLFVDSANNRVGVGTVSPSFPLSVQSNSNAEGLLILGRSGDDIGEIEFRENDNSTVLGELQYQQNHAVLRHRVGDLRFATGGTTERMRIDSSGNLLVGKTSANNGGTVGIELNTNDTAYFTRSGGAGVNINRTTSDGNIALFQKDGTTVGSIGTQGGTLEVGSGDVYLQFNGTNDWIKPVDGSGSNKVNVDLGTSGAKFKDLYLSNSVRLKGATRDISIQQDNYGLRVYDNDASSERFRIDAAGNVGIGASSPDSQLTIGGNVITTLKPTVAISDTTNGGTMTLRGQSPVMFFDCTSSGVGKILTDGQGLEIKDGTLDSQGNVDFKIASSGYLEATSGSQVRLTLGSEGTAGTNTANWIRGVGTSLGFNSASGGYQWEIGGGEKMRIDTSGNLLVGRTSNNWTTVAGVTAQSNGAIIASRAAESGFFNRLSTNGDIVKFHKDGSAVGSIGSEGGDALYIGNGDTGIKFSGGADVLQPFNPSTNSARDAGIDLGSSGARFKDLYLSGGIVFGSTGGAVTSRTLDDYEEGTWTPSISTGTAYASQIGHYTKIGNVVHIKCNIQITSLSAVTNELQGLPFSASNTGQSSGAVNVMYYSNINEAVTWLSGYVINNTSNIYFTGNTGSAITIGKNAFNVFKASTRILFSCTYRTS